MDRSANAVRIFNDRALQYQEKHMAQERYHASFDRFLALLPQGGADVLEVACGPGNITKYLLAKAPELRILGTDLAPRMLELARANVPQATFQELDARAIGTLEERFDGILCGFCLPYLSSEEATQLIHDAAHLLRPDGALYLSTMEADPFASGPQHTSDGKDTVHMYFHDEASLSAPLMEKGFRIVAVMRVEETSLQWPSSNDLIIVARR